jgi:hypothetical protein
MDQRERGHACGRAMTPKSGALHGEIERERVGGAREGGSEWAERPRGRESGLLWFILEFEFHFFIFSFEFKGK